MTRSQTPRVSLAGALSELVGWVARLADWPLRYQENWTTRRNPAFRSSTEFSKRLRIFLFYPTYSNFFSPQVFNKQPTRIFLNNIDNIAGYQI
jgi:hypothetical protein